MPGDSIDDDEYVARLLKQDAVDASKKYSFVGLDAFHPKRTRPDAPKPNTSFLRHIIRQTDSHNAALLAREAKDSRARLRQLDTAKEGEDARSRKRHHEHDPIDREGRSRRERRERHDVSSDEDRERRRSRHRRREEESGHARRERGDRSAHHSKHRREGAHQSRRETEQGQGSRHREHHSRKRARHRSVSPSRGSTRSPSPSRHEKKCRHDRRCRCRKRSRSLTRHREERKNTPNSQAVTRRSPGTDDESDPLEAIVGPLPPPKAPAVRSRGRGALSSSSTLAGIDARFSSAYDPATDHEALLDRGDEWGDAMEAYRDRQRWKQQGAERLKAAGFSEEQVKKWERGDEKNEEDVRWSARGQSREWDRGKVVDADGDVGHRAAWAD